MNSLHAKRYAKGLVAATGADKLESTLQAVDTLAAVFEGEKVSMLVCSPETKEADKIELFVSLLGKKPDAKMVNFIKTLSLHKRLYLIPQIASILSQELQKSKNEYQGVIFSSATLDSKEVSKLEKALGKYAGATIKLTARKADHEGIKISIEDLGLEASFSKDKLASGMIEHIIKAV